MKSLLIVNQYFPPDQAATAQLLGQLTEGISKSMNVTVVCGTPTYAPDAGYDLPKGFLIRRVPLIPGPRKFLPLRILNYLFFLIGAFFISLSEPRHHTVMCWTDPPLVGLIGVWIKWIKGSRFVFVSQDVYPEVAIAARKMDNRLSVFVLSIVSRTILAHADRVIAVGNDMKEILLGKGCPVDKVLVIPNWQDVSSLQSQSKETFRKKNNIPLNAFVVMHSGNLGLSQDFESLLETARLLSNENVYVVIAGDGARQNEVREAIASKSLLNVRMFPYQPVSELAHSLSAADLHYVSLKKDFLGLVVPSKLYGIMAVSRPVLTNVPKGCDVETIVRAAECGLISTSNPSDLSSAIRSVMGNPQSLIKMGENGRKWIEREGGKERALLDYAELALGQESKYSAHHA